MSRSASVGSAIAAKGEVGIAAAFPSGNLVSIAAGGPDLDDILDLDSFLKRYPDIATEARLRWWIFKRQSNGLESSGAIIKRAGRWFVVIPLLRDWLLNSRSGAA